MKILAPSDPSENSEFSSATDHGVSDHGLSDTEYKHDDILGGRYRVISLLGRGGMGVVYKVEQIFLGKELALKTIDRNLMSDITVRRFKAEARAAFAVDHPNLVSVHDFGLFEDQTPFLVMEILRGETLGDRLKRGTLSVEEAIPIFIQVCFGLAHAHESGVVHRDIKPNNIMLLTDVTEGVDVGVKILDFGIAKLTQREGGEVQALTRTGEIFGSPLYMSPEQCTGTKVDHRADVYSLGCVIFESLTGTPPFVGDNALATMMLHQSANIPTLKEGSLGVKFPPELEALVDLMLAKNPDDRYQSLGDAAHDLAALRRGEINQLSAAIQPKRPSGKDSEIGLIKINRSNFYKAMLGVALATFLVSSWLTYLTQAANVPVRPVANKPPEMEPFAPIPNRPAEPALTEESVIFDGQIMRGSNKLESKMATDLSLRALKDYTLAQIVELQDGNITDSGIEYLKNSKVLTLGLHACSIDRLDNITKLPYLQSLDLDKTEINDSAIPKITSLKMLHTLSLKDCDISEDGIRGLAHSNSLIALSLTPKKYSESFINEMSDKMPQCVILPYRNMSKFAAMEQNVKAKDLPALREKQIVIAEKANKNCSAIGVLTAQLAMFRFQEGRVKETRALNDRAVAHLDRIGELTALLGPLGVQANFATYDKNAKRALALTDRAEHILLDTRQHNNDKELLPLLDGYTAAPIQFKDFDRAIEYCKTAVDLIDKYPGLDEKNMLPSFLERIGWLYAIEKKLDLSVPYYKRTVEITQLTRDKDPKPYLRAIIEYSNSLNLDHERRKKLYDEGIEGLEKLGLPEELNLKDHYLNACSNMAAMLSGEQNHDGSVIYLRKALDAHRQMKTKNSNRRLAFSQALVHELRAGGHEAEAKKEALKYGVKF